MMKKVIALILALVTVFALASCGKNGNEDETTTTAAAEEVNGTTANIDETTTAGTDESTVPASEEDTSAAEATSEEASSEEESSAPEAKKPETAAEILAAYTQVMDYAKKNAPGFKKIEYQALPEDKRNFSSDLVLDIAANFMTSEKKARENPEMHNKGDNTRWFPVYKTPDGCLLKDTSAIKSAKCEELPNGNYKITIVLNAEMNPEPPADGATVSPSKTGAMFSPLSKKDIDDTIQNNKIVNVVVRSATYSLKYYDCTAILIYNPENNHIESLTQYMHVLIDADIKLFVGSLKGSAVLDNDLYITDFKY